MVKAMWTETRIQELKLLYSLHGKDYQRIASASKSFSDYTPMQIKNGIRQHITNAENVALAQVKQEPTNQASSSSSSIPVAASKRANNDVPAKKQKLDNKDTLENKFLPTTKGDLNSERVIAKLKGCYTPQSQDAEENDDDLDDTQDEIEEAFAQPMPASKKHFTGNVDEYYHDRFKTLDDERMQFTPNKGVTTQKIVPIQQPVVTAKLDYCLKPRRVLTEKKAIFIFREVPGLKPTLQWIKVAGRGIIG